MALSDNANTALIVFSWCGNGRADCSALLRVAEKAAIKRLGIIEAIDPVTAQVALRKVIRLKKNYVHLVMDGTTYRPLSVQYTLITW